MDYQYGSTNQINISNMDYWTLVNMLMNQITPDIRKQILDRLTEMNNQLLPTNRTQPEISRTSILNSRKKDLNETQHPSLDLFNYSNQNPLPLFPIPNIPINTNNSYNLNSYQMGTLPQMNTTMPLKYQLPNPKQTDEIDLDDILDEIHEKEPDELDIKLANIKKLHSKIVTDKRRRRLERENK